jgi:hypothetical protein
MEAVRLDGRIHGKLGKRLTLDNKTKPARRSFIEEGTTQVSRCRESGMSEFC